MAPRVAPSVGLLLQPPQMAPLPPQPLPLPGMQSLLPAHLQPMAGWQVMPPPPPLHPGAPPVLPTHTVQAGTVQGRIVPQQPLQPLQAGQVLAHLQTMRPLPLSATPFSPQIHLPVQNAPSAAVGAGGPLVRCSAY